MSPAFFPFSDYWWLYALFTLFVLILLALDLGVFHRYAHEVSFREAAIWSAIWIGLALLFNCFLYFYALWIFLRDARLAGIAGFNSEAAALQLSLEFLTGYLVEKTLSLDNIF